MPKNFLIVVLFVSPEWYETPPITDFSLPPISTQRRVLYPMISVNPPIFYEEGYSYVVTIIRCK